MTKSNCYDAFIKDYIICGCISRTIGTAYGVFNSNAGMIIFGHHNRFLKNGCQTALFVQDVNCAKRYYKQQQTDERKKSASMNQQKPKLPAQLLM